jgi:hypothetical protein
MTLRSKAIQELLCARAVRQRAQRMLELCERNQLRHWRLQRQRLPALVDYVIDTSRRRYPRQDIPFHARWRHFSVNGQDRWQELARQADWSDGAQLGRAAFDLAIVSVLLDAGAGPNWRYRDAGGNVLNRSEGLAIASFEMFAAGAFSAIPDDPYRIDASRLESISRNELAGYFQVNGSNALLGLDGRIALLNALGSLVAADPAVFSRHDAPRPGGLFDYLSLQTATGKLSAEVILEALLTTLTKVWPSRLSLDGIGLGDCWYHSAITYDDETSGLVPFHKLSQWLAYSLIEPLQWAGFEITDIDGLTGLPEYRNGGLFVDLEVLCLQHQTDVDCLHEPDSPLVVEWRALTVALLDEVAVMMRNKLGLTAAALPLAKILEGGTWAAGRRIAAEKRTGGAPPLLIASDGTLF